jgi:hypothetical protein
VIAGLVPVRISGDVWEIGTAKLPKKSGGAAGDFLRLFI